jgi:hypothetical protein
VDLNCAKPPNCLRLDQAFVNRRQSHGGTKKDKTPIVHVHIGCDQPLGKVGNSEPAHKHPASPTSDSETSDSSSNDNDAESIPIANILQSLNRKLPTHNYLQYKDALVKNGILYAQSALDFDKDTYVSDLGMVVGAVGPFLRKVTKVVEGSAKAQAKRSWAKKREKKRARLAAAADA